jgi:hypothetical protein
VAGTAVWQSRQGAGLGPGRSEENPSKSAVLSAGTGFWQRLRIHQRSALSLLPEQHITFTRARPYRKNDSCFVEQKNYSVVRRAVGYQRFDTEQQLALLNEVYELLDLYNNFFQPSMKLQSKERHGALHSKTKTFNHVQSLPVSARTKRPLTKPADSLFQVEAS